jgi:hypothetical protein
MHGRAVTVYPSKMMNRNNLWEFMLLGTPSGEKPENKA